MHMKNLFLRLAMTLAFLAAGVTAFAGHWYSERRGR